MGNSSEDDSAVGDESMVIQSRLDELDNGVVKLDSRPRSRGTIGVGKNKERDEKGCFDVKNEEHLSWRRYCHSRFSLKDRIQATVKIMAERRDSGADSDAEWLTGGPPREAEVSPKSAAQAETHPQMGRRSESESTWAARAYQ